VPQRLSEHFCRQRCVTGFSTLTALDGAGEEPRRILCAILSVTERSE
jgi:hypothetical protein